MCDKMLSSKHIYAPFSVKLLILLKYILPSTPLNTLWALYYCRGGDAVCALSRIPIVWSGCFFNISHLLGHSTNGHDNKTVITPYNRRDKSERARVHRVRHDVPHSRRRERLTVCVHLCVIPNGSQKKTLDDPLDSSKVTDTPSPNTSLFLLPDLSG